MLGSGRGGEQHHHHGDSLHAWHCGWLYSGCLAAQSMILVAPSTILLISVFFYLFVNHQSPAQSQIFHLDNLPQKHQQCSWSSYKNVPTFHLPLVRRWKAVTLLRVHFSKQSDSVWNSTQLPRNQLQNQQPDIFSSKLIFFLGLSEEKRFSPLAKIFHNCVR